MALSSDQPHHVNGRSETPEPPTADGVAVVMVPLPAQGHLNQLLHLSRLIASYGVPVHYVAANTHIHQAKLRLQGWDPSSATAKRLLHFHSFEIPSFPTPSPDSNSTSKFPSHLIPAFKAAALHLRHHVAALVQSLSSGSHRVVVVHDSLMGSAVQDTFSIPNAESYTFHSISAFSCCWYLAEAYAGSRLSLEEHYGSSLKDTPLLKDCFSVDFFELVEDQYKFRNHRNSGFLYNTTRAVEGVSMELLEGAEVEGQKHWAVGPFNPVRAPPSPLAEKHRCIEWLDGHLHDSVIYVSFGTTVTLAEDQVREIATGLEISGQRFIWVLREADKGVDNGRTGAGLGLALPEGFEERVKTVGLVLRDWAPQLEILGHPSVGGFMSHCGWNSCMESISMGVPIVGWPMHSDQPSNSILVTKILKVGVMVKEWSELKEGGLVQSSSIEAAVKELMSSSEGDAMRKRAAELGEAIRASADDKGVSRADLDSFIAHIAR